LKEFAMKYYAYAFWLPVTLGLVLGFATGYIIPIRIGLFLVILCLVVSVASVVISYRKANGDGFDGRNYVITCLQSIAFATVLVLSYLLFSHI